MPARLQPVVQAVLRAVNAMSAPAAPAVPPAAQAAPPKADTGRRSRQPAAKDSDKYDITRHPNFKYTADADKRNTFDIEAFLSARLKLKPDEVCDVYEVDTEGV